MRQARAPQVGWILRLAERSSDQALPLHWACCYLLGLELRQTGGAGGGGGWSGLCNCQQTQQPRQYALSMNSA